jgi:DNA-binding response OmpR family regulator
MSAFDDPHIDAFIAIILTHHGYESATAESLEYMRNLYKNRTLN